MAPKPKKKTRAQMLANPNWRSKLPDSALTPAQRKQRARLKAQRADPLAPVATMKDLTGQANEMVSGQLAPEFASIKADEDRAKAEFDTRSQLYGQLAGRQSTDMSNAFTAVNTALNGIMTSQAGLSAADQANLAAALRQADNNPDAIARSLGVSGPSPQDEQQLIAAAAERNAAQQGQFAANAASGATAMGERAAIPGQAFALNIGQLTGERNQQLKETAGRRREIDKQRPGLARQAVKDLQEFELAKRQYGDQKANMLFQQYLAQQELGMKEKDQTFQQWLAQKELGLKGRAQSLQERVAGAEITGTDPKTGKPTLSARQIVQQAGIDWARIGIDQKTAEAQIRAMEADAAKTKDTGKKEAAQRRATAMANGIVALNDFLKPQAGEALTSSHGAYPYNPGTPDPDPDKPGNQGTGPYKRLFDDALRTMTGAGMTRSDALRWMSRYSNYGDWRKKATRLLGRGKRRPARKKPSGRNIQIPAAPPRY